MSEEVKEAEEAFERVQRYQQLRADGYLKLRNETTGQTILMVYIDALKIAITVTIEAEQ